MGETTKELAVDVLEVVVAAAIVLAYGYSVLIQGERIDDSLIEGLVIVSSLAMFGDQYQEHLSNA